MVDINGISESGDLVGAAAKNGTSGVTYPVVAQPKFNTDGDGLLDSWETNGITIKGRFLDLPAMGADPNHKDIFVEADFMFANDHSHDFITSARQDVIAAFAAAPVTNPDNRPGITLHIDAGPDSVMDPKTGATWGSRSNTTAIGETTLLGTYRNGQYDWHEFESLKKKHFDAELRGKAFHYAIFAHSLGGIPDRTGVGKIRGGDLIVSLGSVQTDNLLILQRHQSGTLMHELGHNLGLGHSGDSDLPNYEPNYLSVMNYAFQPGILHNGIFSRIDYSSHGPDVLPNLNESALNETTGLGAPAFLEGFGTVHFCGSEKVVELDIHDPMDWNCDGNYTATNLTISINGNSELETLSSFNDWGNLFFAFNGVDSSGGVILPAQSQQFETANDEATVEELIQNLALSLYLVDVTGFPFQYALPGTAQTYSFKVKNAGKKADNYTVSGESSQSWTAFPGLPTSITLEPGQSVIFDATISIPVNTPFGSVDLTRLHVRSAHTPDRDEYSEIRTYVGLQSEITCAGMPATIVGTDKDDVIYGTPGQDIIVGRNGNDILHGLDGPDRICGGNGDDVIDGGNGNDDLYGDNGNDLLKGSSGDDTLLGGRGDNILDGGNDTDRCESTAGKQVLRGCEE